jgi:hypothetical protein
MKRRASIQLVPSKAMIGEYEDPYSTQPEEFSPSKRIIYKAKKPTNPSPDLSPYKLENVASNSVIQESSNYLSLLELLKSSDSHEKTEEFLKEINAVDIISPRRILPNPSSTYEILYSLESKLYVNSINKGKGLLQITKAVSSKVALIIFRDCIKKILFTGAVYHNSRIIIKKETCKPKHDNKIDLEIVLLQQPEGLQSLCIICCATKDLQELKNALEKAFDYIKG